MDCDKKFSAGVRSALKEDIGRNDITTSLFIPADKSIKADLVAKEVCVVCGLGIACLVLKAKDKNIKFMPKVKDGDFVRKGKAIARVQGNARQILTAERVMLNYICFLSGVATKARQYVNAAKPYRVKIIDTRKTVPGLRELEKYAVRVGGGFNHRMRLDEMILIKDNHIEVLGDRSWVLGFDKIRKRIPKNIKIEIEVKNLREFKKALKMTPDIILLDNMSISDMKKAVSIRNNLSPATYHLIPKLEASGRVTLERVKKIASCGVDMISVGSLTHSVRSIDMSLEVL
ncbi:MAG: carboxylating nicotinate-nucleotide diphosphorylase [Candidatus Omnitrophota bacterium]